MRSKKALKNTIVGLINQFVTIICAFIVPRLILTTFGSTYNGITSAVSQFLGFASLFQSGIFGVTAVALYKPLAEGDTHKISVIVRTTELFFRKIAALFLVVMALVAALYPFLVIDEFDWFFTASLVVIMSVSAFAQYLFASAYHVLLYADQRQSFTQALSIVTTIANTLIAWTLLKLGFGIRVVMLGTATVNVTVPVFIGIYTRKNYSIIRNVEPDYTTIKQRWDSFGKQVASYVCENTDLVILSFFTSPLEISVYAVYNMVCAKIQGLFDPLVKGLAAAFGNMFAKEEIESIERNFRLLEQLVFAAATFLFGVSAVLIVPFVMVYTRGVTDVNYHRAVFSLILIAAMLFKCYRYPYEAITVAAGHFKQTRNADFIEAGINVVLSLILVSKLGIVGVILGTLTAYVFRTIYYAIYVSKHVIRRNISMFLKRMILSLCNILLIILLSKALPITEINDFLHWLINAVVLSVAALVIIFATELVFYRNDLINVFAMLRRAIKRDNK